MSTRTLDPFHKEISEERKALDWKNHVNPFPKQTAIFIVFFVVGFYTRYMPVNISASPPEPLLMSCYQIFSSGSARRELATALWGTQRTQVSRVGKISGLCSAPASSLLDTTTYGVSFMMPTTAARVLDQILFHRVCSCKCGPLLGGFHFSKVLGWWQWSHFKIPPGNLATCSHAT